MSRRTTLWTLGGLAALGFALRVAAIILLHRWTQPNAIEHRALAFGLLKTHTFYFRDFNYFGPSSVQSPPYPMMLAILFKAFGPDSASAYIAAMVVNSLAGAATVYLTYGLIRVLGGTDWIGILAAALVGVWPSQVYTATHVQAVSLITAGIVAMFYFFQLAVSSGRLAPWIGYSLVGTLAALTEPVLLPVLALSGILILFWKSLSMQQRFRNAAVLLAAAVLIIMPWTIRNHTVHGQWMPIKSTFWVNVWKGNNPNATGTDRLEMTEEKKDELKVTSLSLSDEKAVDPSEDNPHQYDALTPQQRAQLNRKPEAEREKIFQQFAKSWIAANPGKYLKLCLKRLGMSLLFDLDNPKARNLIWIASRIILLQLTIAGLVMAWRRKWHLLFPLLVWGSALLTYTLTVTANRFAIPFEPLQLALTALVLSKLYTPRIREAQGFPVATSKSV